MYAVSAPATITVVMPMLTQASTRILVWPPSDPPVRWPRGGRSSGGGGGPAAAAALRAILLPGWVGAARWP
ncbi:hypothetical protein GCM10022224_096860 [Nonomuraea antimicrobica]|uniref:Uncharacterized protein n=1 Tax=Nonomuraea antimicrobica TaxID=561173 RepID=A0ABP7E8R7_9ACTN